MYFPMYKWAKNCGCLVSLSSLKVEIEFESDARNFLVDSSAGDSAKVECLLVADEITDAKLQEANRRAMGPIVWNTIDHDSFLVADNKVAAAALAASAAACASLAAVATAAFAAAVAVALAASVAAMMAATSAWAASAAAAAVALASATTWLFVAAACSSAVVATCMAWLLTTPFA